MDVHINDIPSGILITDNQLNIVQCNTHFSQIIGIEIPELVSKTLWELIPPASRIFLQTHILPNIFKNTSLDEVFIKILSHDGHEIPILLNVSQIIQDNEEFLYWSIFVANERSKMEVEIIRRRELSEKAAADLKRLSEELAIKHKSLSDFTKIVTHDLKAPLRGITSLSEWISDELTTAPPEELIDLFSKLMERVRRLDRLIDDIHKYSQAGMNHGDLETIELAPFINTIFEFLSPPKPFQLHYHGDVSELITLRVPFELVMRNLINNAIKHHDEDNGKITVLCKDHEKHYLIKVIDNGPGIDPKHHDTIFNEFKRLKPQDSNQGTGLGLSFVKKTIESYGGEVHVVSQIGSGAEFIFKWPKNPAPARLNLPISETP